MNLNKLMKQAQKMQEQMAKVQAGGGKVTVIANGAGEVVAIKIDKAIVDPNDVEFLEEVVLSGVKAAIEQGKSLAQSEMTKITGGLGIPGRGDEKRYKVTAAVRQLCMTPLVDGVDIVGALVKSPAAMPGRTIRGT